MKKGYLIDSILDTAGQKGTGKWTSVESLDRGVALPTITSAVFARYTATEKPLRAELAKLYREKILVKKPPQNAFVKTLDDALYVAIISTYAQGFHLIQAAAIEEGWQVDLGEVARIWQGGCIIRAKLLTTIHEAYQKKSDQQRHLFVIPNIARAMKKSHKHLRELVSLAAQSGIPTPAFGASWYFSHDPRTPSAIIQARDYFGAHTYERIDRPGIFHTIWK